MVCTFNAHFAGQFNALIESVVYAGPTEENMQGLAGNVLVLCHIVHPQLWVRLRVPNGK
jgi:hypothetical protein